MKRVFFFVLILLGGLLTGGAAAFAVSLVQPGPKSGDHATEAAAKERDATPEFVPAEVLLPLVDGDGQLATYATIKLELRVEPGSGEEVKERLPLLLNAINLRTYRTPLATGPDGRLPDLAGFRLLVQSAADQSLGKGTIRQIAITEARTS